MNRENTKRLICLLMVVSIITSSLVITLDHSTGITEDETPAQHPWASFGGDRRNTRRSPFDTSHVDGTVKWSTYAVSDTKSVPVIDQNGILYSHSITSIAAYDTKDGSQLWRLHFTDSGTFIDRPESISPAISDDGTIYVSTVELDETSYSLSAVNPNGTLKWKYNYQMERTSIYMDTSPQVGTDNVIYFLARRLYALNPDGTLKWKSEDMGISGSGIAIGDNAIYLSSGTYLMAFCKFNGTVKWEIHAGTSTPTIGDDGTIYVTNSYTDEVIAVSPNATIKWRYHIGRDLAYLRSFPAVGSDGMIYVTGNNSLYALNPDGKLIWRFATTGGFWEASPVVGGDGTIYFSASDGFIYAVRPNGTLKWKYDLGHPWALERSPAICGKGDVYIMGKQLHAFSDRTADNKERLIPGFNFITTTISISLAMLVYKKRRFKG